MLTQIQSSENVPTMTRMDMDDFHVYLYTISHLQQPVHSLSVAVADGNRRRERFFASGQDMNGKICAYKYLLEVHFMGKVEKKVSPAALEVSKGVSKEVGGPIWAPRTRS
jgi:hypothetical protein